MTLMTEYGLFFLLTIGIKSLLIGGIVGVLLKLATDSNLKHRIATGLLISMLALPVMVTFAPSVDLPILGASATESLPSPTDGPTDGLVEARSWSELGEGQEQFPATVVAEVNSPETSRPESAVVQAPTVISTKANVGSQIQPSHSGASADLGSWITWQSMLLSIYVIGVLFFAARLIAGLWLAHRLVSSSRPVGNLPLSIDLGRAVALESEMVNFPQMVGFYQPKILLPTNWRDWSDSKLGAVLAHELTHVRRGDWIVKVVSEVNVALHWFNPVAWVLRNYLADRAEEICDDEVIRATNDRPAYARHLLEIASQFSAQSKTVRRAALTLSMAQTSAVENRIDLILDARRPLARRVSWISLLVILVLLVPTSFLAAGLSPCASDLNGSPEVVAASSSSSGSFNDLSLVYEGKLLDHQGRAVSGAKLYLVPVDWWNRQFVKEPLTPHGTTDQQGQFRIATATSKFPAVEKKSGAIPFMKLVAVVDGENIGWNVAACFEKTGNLDQLINKMQKKTIDELTEKAQGVFRMGPAGTSITGQIVDSDNQPLSGVNVSVSQLTQATSQTLGEHFKNNRNAAAQSARGLAGILPHVVTDAEGKFTIDGLGEQQIAELLIHGDEIVWKLVQVQNLQETDYELQPNELQSQMGGEFKYIYANDFQFTAEASIPITGTVRDRESGKPVPGVQIVSQHHWVQTVDRTREVGNPLSFAVTDKKGRYSLCGLPTESGNQIEFRPPAGVALMRTIRQVDTNYSTDQREFVALDVDLFNGRLVEVTVTETESGKPVLGQIEYTPAEENPRKGEYCTQLDSSWSGIFRTDLEGKFQCAIPTGKGYWAFTAYDTERYTKVRPTVKGARIRPASYSMGGRFHAFKEVDIAEGQANLNFEMTVERPYHVVGKMLGPDGSPFEVSSDSYGQYWGAADRNPVWRVIQPGESTFEIVGLQPNEQRTLLFLFHKAKLAGIHRQDGRSDDDVNVQLYQWATLKGRLLDPEGNPMSEVFLTNGGPTMWNQSFSSPDEMRPRDFGTPAGLELPPQGNKSTSAVRTDKDGNFEIVGLVPNEAYDVYTHLKVKVAEGEEHDGKRRNPEGGLSPFRVVQLPVATELNLRPGETRDLGDVQLVPGEQ